MKVSVADATATQLADYAKIHWGLDVNFRQGRDRILATLSSAGFRDNVIEVPDEAQAQPAQPGPQMRPAPEILASGDDGDEANKIVYIVISQQNEAGGKDPVPVAVNGRAILIPRGKPVGVPAKYVEALRNAQRVMFEQGDNGEPINPYFVPTHPFSVVNKPDVAA